MLIINNLIVPACNRFLSTPSCAISNNEQILSSSSQMQMIERGKTTLFVESLDIITEYFDVFDLWRIAGVYLLNISIGLGWTWNTCHRFWISLWCWWTRKHCHYIRNALHHIVEHILKEAQHSIRYAQCTVQRIGWILW